MNNNVSLDRLNEHLFDVIERLKDSFDPDADIKDTIDVQTASQICNAGKIIVDAYKVKAQVLNIAVKCSDPKVMAQLSNNLGITQIPEKTAAELEKERINKLLKS
jgi:hypothetical protein